MRSIATRAIEQARVPQVIVRLYNAIPVRRERGLELLLLLIQVKRSSFVTLRGHSK
jgi:hypothetical protein